MGGRAPHDPGRAALVFALAILTALTFAPCSVWRSGRPKA